MISLNFNFLARTREILQSASQRCGEDNPGPQGNTRVYPSYGAVMAAPGWRPRERRDGRSARP